MERSSPSRVAGTVAREVTLAGETYILSQPDRVRRAADEESVVIARRLDMLPALAKACEGLPEDSRDAWRQAYIEKMVCGIASPEEWGAYYRSRWDFAFRFWNALDPKHKVEPGSRRQRTLLEGVAWAYEILCGDEVTQEEVEALGLAIRMVSQADAVKNSSGSQESGATPQTETPTSEAGQPSTSSS